MDAAHRVGIGKVPRIEVGTVVAPIGLGCGVTPAAYGVIVVVRSSQAVPAPRPLG